MKSFAFSSLTVAVLFCVSASASDGGGDCGSSTPCDSGTITTTAAVSSTYTISGSTINLTSRATSGANDYGMVFAKGGVAFGLSQRLSNGDNAIDFTSLGQTLVKIIRNQEVPLSAADQAILIESLLHNWGVMGVGNDPRVSLLLQALQPVRAAVPFNGLIKNPSLKDQFRNLFVALSLVEAHRRLTTEEQNVPLRGLFASIAYGQIRLILDYRDIMKDYPSDQQILDLLTQFRKEVGAESRATWKPMVELMGMNLTDALQSEHERQLVGPELKVASLSAASGMGLYVAGMMTGIDWINAHHVAAFAMQGMLVAPMLTGGMGFGWMAWTRQKRLERSRAKVEDFIQQCHANLVQ